MNYKNKDTTDHINELLKIGLISTKINILIDIRNKIKSVDKSKNINDLENEYVEYIREERNYFNNLNNENENKISNFFSSFFNDFKSKLTKIELFFSNKQIKKLNINPLSIFITNYFLYLIIPMRKLDEDLKLIDEEIFIMMYQYYDNVIFKTKQECIDYFLDSRYCNNTCNLSNNKIKKILNMIEDEINMIDLELALDTPEEERSYEQFYIVYNYTLLEKCKSYKDIML